MECGSSLPLSPHRLLEKRQQAAALHTACNWKDCHDSKDFPPAHDRNHPGRHRSRQTIIAKNRPSGALQ